MTGCRTGTCGRRCSSGRSPRATASSSAPTSPTTPGDGKPTEQHAAYYAARAAGGAGLIITEEHSTHPTDWPYEKLIHGFHRDVIPGYRTITEAVHRHRVPIFAQINHNGGQASSMYSRLPVWAPSAVADPLFREVPKAVTHAEIDEIVAGYALVAEHCAEGGFDGIELQCSHSSIVRGFLSPATNKRTDEYGGSLVNRARLLLRDRRRRARRDRQPPRPRRAHLRRRADRRRHDDRRRRRDRPAGRGQRSRRLHQHLDRRRHREPVHDRGEHAHPARLRDVHPVGDPQGGRAAGRRRRAVQGSAAGRAGPGRGALRSRRRRARPDRRRRLRRQGARPGRPTRSACACRATRSASGGWASTAGSAASRTRAPAGKRERGPPTPTSRVAGQRSTVLVVGAGPARAAGGDRRGAQRSRRDRVREGAPTPAGRCGWRRRCRTAPSSAT